MRKYSIEKGYQPSMSTMKIVLRQQDRLIHQLRRELVINDVEIKEITYRTVRMEVTVNQVIKYTRFTHLL